MTESLLKEIMTENFPNLERDLIPRFMKLIGNPQISIQKIFSKIHYNKQSKIEDRDNFKNRKKKD